MQQSSRNQRKKFKGPIVVQTDVLKLQSQNYQHSNRIHYMLQSKYQTSYGIVARLVHSSSRQTNTQRQTIQPNQIFLTDFSNTNHRYEIKKKLCPLFLASKLQKRKNLQNKTIFTSQGILHQSEFCSQKTTVYGERRVLAISHTKAFPFGAKKQQLNSAYNFTRTITPKKRTVSQNINVCSIYSLYPEGRSLSSAKTDQQRLLLIKRKSNSRNSLKRRLKSQGNKGKAKQLGGWQTIDIDFDEVL